jgi:hypothetical protein
VAGRFDSAAGGCAASNHRRVLLRGHKQKSRSIETKFSITVIGLPPSYAARSAPIFFLRESRRGS